MLLGWAVLARAFCTCQVQKGDGLETRLYLACQLNPPLQLTQVLIQADQDALAWTSREHADFPLHIYHSERQYHHCTSLGGIF
jgi:hypothetical protein